MSAVEAIDFTRRGDWARDPKHLLFVLARYKHVAKLLEGQSQVLEVGCGDAFASNVVRQHVGNLVCTDADEKLIAEAVSREAPIWDKAFRVHDMVRDGAIWLTDKPLPTKFSAAYALDVLEHIDPILEFTFLSNLRDSVDKIAVIGMPSLESQPYASENSRVGHVNCKTAAQLRESMLKHFRVVFMFGIQDETLTTGFDAMRHYLLAVGVK